jgi:hypothetical protein
MKFKSYELVTRAVEEGVAYGIRRAYKHTNTPSMEAIEGAVVDAVTSALCDILDFTGVEND